MSAMICWDIIGILQKNRDNDGDSIGDISWDVSSYARGKYHEIEILLHPPNMIDIY